jgi:hypothetical protein
MTPLSQGSIRASRTELLKPAARTSTGAATSALVDLRGFTGPVVFAFHTAKASAGSSPTLTPTLVHAAAANGSPVTLTDVTWLKSDGETEVTVVTDSADPGVVCAIIDPRETDGFVGFVGTIAGSNASYPCSAWYEGTPAGYVPASADPA